MSLTEELIQFYSPYFKSKEELKKALSYGTSSIDREKNIKFIKTAVKNHSKCLLQIIHEITGIIITPKYEIHFAILPSGDVAYYTVNKKSKRKGNFQRIMGIKTLHNHLIKLGVLDESIGFDIVLCDLLFGEEQFEKLFNKLQSEGNPNNDEDDWYSISLNTSMLVDVEFSVIVGNGEIIRTTEGEVNEIGSIRFKIYNSNLVSKYQLWEAADASSGDEEWLMAQFLKLFEEELEACSPKFLTVNKLSIKSEYRNKGYGTEAIKELIRLSHILDIDYIVLHPAPIENIDFNDESKMKRIEEIDRLIAFYSKLDFDTYRFEDNDPIMVFDMNSLSNG